MNSSRTSRGLLLLAGLAGVASILYASTRLFGGVRGEEFSPDTFQRRTFAYHEIPLLRIQATPMVREEKTNSLERYLFGERLVPQTASPEPRWDLVRFARAGRGPVVGDAEILCAFLDARTDSGIHLWKEWSERNAELAKILWAEVQQLAEHRLYLLVPDLFELAERASEAAEFRQAIDDILADRYAALGAVQLELGNPDMARQMVERAERHAPQRASLRKLQQRLQEAATDPGRQ
jgi:hypothetical protein